MTEHSDNYGEINYELVGTIDFKEIFATTSCEDYLKWSDKYHQRTFFSSFKMVRLNLSKDENLDTFEIYVPVDDINKSWNPDFWYNKYPTLKRTKNRKLPIATSRKKVELWKIQLLLLTNPTS